MPLRRLHRARGNYEPFVSGEDTVDGDAEFLGVLDKLHRGLIVEGGAGSRQM